MHAWGRIGGVAGVCSRKNNHEIIIMATLTELCAGLPLDPLPPLRPRDPSLPHAPVRTPNLSSEEKKVRCARCTTTLFREHFLPTTHCLSIASLSSSSLLPPTHSISLHCRMPYATSRPTFTPCWLRSLPGS